MTHSKTLTSPTFLEIEQLTICIFAFLPKWKMARYSPSDFAGFVRTVAPMLDVKLYDHQIKALDLAHRHLMKPPPTPCYLFPASWTMTAIGPMPRKLRDEIVLAMDPIKDDLRNRESWLRTVKRMDGR